VTCTLAGARIHDVARAVGDADHAARVLDANVARAVSSISTSLREAPRAVMSPELSSTFVTRTDSRVMSPLESVTSDGQPARHGHREVERCVQQADALHFFGDLHVHLHDVALPLHVQAASARGTPGSRRRHGPRR